MRILVADDDVISLRFLESALQQMGCDTIGAAELSQALTLAADAPPDLALLDRNMPGGGGIALLAALRKAGIGCPAIATSAEITAQARAELQVVGFIACLEKPVAFVQLREFLQPWLGLNIPALDDAGGLAAIGGDAGSLLALRTLLVQELAALHAGLAQDCIDPGALLERLHRLRASCGFCGAPKLGAAASEFEHALRTGADAAARRDAFVACCMETLAALRV